MKNILLPLEPLVLSIGIGGENGPLAPTGETPIQIGFHKLNARFVCQTAPDHVISWLFCSAYDAYDIGRVLKEAGYHRRFSIFAPRLPKVGVVQRELSRCFPEMEIMVISLPALSPKVDAYLHAIEHAASEPRAERGPAVPVLG